MYEFVYLYVSREFPNDPVGPNNLVGPFSLMRRAKPTSPHTADVHGLGAYTLTALTTLQPQA